MNREVKGLQDARLSMSGDARLFTSSLHMYGIVPIISTNSIILYYPVPSSFSLSDYNIGDGGMQAFSTAAQHLTHLEGLE